MQDAILITVTNIETGQSKQRIMPKDRARRYRIGTLFQYVLQNPQYHNDQSIRWIRDEDIETAAYTETTIGNLMLTTKNLARREHL